MAAIMQIFGSSNRASGTNGGQRFVVFASSVGTIFEWYDFYLYAVLAPFFASLFFPAGNDTAALLSALATYAAGFLVRPFGALVFGRIGDLVGRKHTFLVTIIFMGTSTFLVGLLPTYASIGWVSPILLVTLRLLQGLAVGGEYGGAAIYVAEHADPARRGYATSWITYLLVLIALIIGTPFFILVGWLSDQVGRLKIMLAGCLIAALTYFPLFMGLTHYTDPSLEAFSGQHPVTITADASTCGLHVFVTAFTKFSSCDRARDLLTKLGVSFKTEHATDAGDKVDLRIGATIVQGFDVGRWNMAFLDAGYPNLQRDNDGRIVPKPADAAEINWLMAELILITMVIYATMVYGPAAAFLVELFPTRIRYTSLSLPYHIGAGCIGGMVPFVATAVAASTGNIYSGLWYPIVVAVMTARVGGLLLRDTKDVDIRLTPGGEAAYQV